MKMNVFICRDIYRRYDIYFVEIGADDNNVRFSIQSAPILSVKSIVQSVKSSTAKELFRLHPEVE